MLQHHPVHVKSVSSWLSLQAEATKLYAAEVYPDIVSRHRARSERGRSGVATYSSQVTDHISAACIDLTPHLEQGQHAAAQAQ